jgi:hypothetical protein
MEDYTHQAVYTVNDGEVAAVSAGGVISSKRRGETSILVRAAGQVASVGAGVIGPPVADYPKIPRANFIDDYVFEKLRNFQIIPSDLAGDSEFLRRVCLDLTGTLPPPQRVRDFLASTDPHRSAAGVVRAVALGGSDFPQSDTPPPPAAGHSTNPQRLTA